MMFLKGSTYYTVLSSDTCALVAIKNRISLNDFYFLNPEINSTSCDNLWLGSAYCVKAVGNIATYSGYRDTTTTANPCHSLDAPSSCFVNTYATTSGFTWPAVGSATATASSSASASSFTATNDLPLAPGSWANCSAYTQYWTPSSSRNGNTCGYKAWIYDVTIAQLITWNPSLKYNASTPNDCMLEAGYRYCADGNSSSATAATTTTTTPSSSTSGSGSAGVVTPTPTQTGMVSTCSSFYFVQSGDTCYDIAADNGITLAEFYEWNPAVGDDCATLQAGYYVW
ncbi:hypothetical protein N0V82_006186 [Gnomoniopsis sp. IMI 355080]|nr:hypothetical protein N0V82_006186 [Gnomoniopsis sp. IMI 355080]